MAMEASEIARLIKESLPDAEVKIEDLRGDGDHYAAQVVSAAFDGKSRVQQHQMVYEALRGRMGDQLMRWPCRPRRRNTLIRNGLRALGLTERAQAHERICPHMRVRNSAHRRLGRRE